MEREQVKQILLFCRDIQGEISLNNSLLRDYEEQYYSMSGGGQNDGMPKSKYKTSSPVENIVLNIPESASAAMGELRRNADQLCALQAAVLSELNKLPLSQKTILHDFYIRGLKWVRISAHVNYSETQCKKIRNRGLDNLAYRFMQNDLIKNFNYPS